MLDWGTYAIEAVGLVILCVWIVVPAREFKRIIKSLKQKESERKEKGSSFTVQRSSSVGTENQEPRTRNASNDQT